MIPAGFDYARARNVRDALNALAAGDGTKLLAGGHSLIPAMRLRLAQPPKVVDIAGLKELSGIATKGRGLKIGATTTYRELLDSPLVAERAPLIAEACRTIGDVQVRNRGTIGGGVAHADPASDMAAVLLALDASIQLRSRTARRSVPARGFFQGPFTTAMAQEELLTDIVVPPLPRGATTAYLSFEQAASGYPLVGVAVVVARSRKTVTQCAVALTGVSDHAFLAASSQALVGTTGDAAAVAAVADGALTGVSVNGDIHAPADYRAHLTGVAVRRALAIALGRAR